MSGDPIFGELARGWRQAEHEVADWFHREPRTPGTDPYASAETPAATATIETTTQEEPVSLSADLHAFADRVGKFDEEVLNDVEAIQANPKTAEAFGLLRGLTGVNAEPIFDAAVGLLRVVAPQAAVPAEPVAAAPVPAGPQVSGQAQ